MASRPPATVAGGDTGDKSALSCWCGNADLIPFGSDYAECRECGSLVLRKQLSASDLTVDDDNSSFYGKQYWLQHQQADLDYPDIYARTRTDLPERNLHWLKALLKYQLPPARVVELGCAHGSFVALMQQAGFSASGVEMSPWVVGFAGRTFGIDVKVGPIESIDMPARSLDVIALMDVLEHIPDPASTMALCLDLLKDDGLLLIQTPEFREGMKFDRLIQENSSFLNQLKADEHIYLFSQRSVTEFFHRLGARHIAFEPAIFAHYDMFFAVSRKPLHAHTEAEVEQALMAIPQARIAMALLDMKDRFDAAPVLEAELSLRNQLLDAQYVRADQLANARNLAEAELADLLSKYRALDADRQARGEVITSLEAQVGELLRQLEEVHAAQQGQDAAQLTAELELLTRQFESSEADRAARLAVIEAQGVKLSALEQGLHERLQELQQVYDDLSAAKSFSQQAALELDSLKRQLAFAEADRDARLQVIEAQGDKLSGLEQALHERLGELQQTYEGLAAARGSSHQMALELDSLKQQLAFAESDRAARLQVIESQGGEISSLHSQVHARLEELKRLYSELNAVAAAGQELSRDLAALQGRYAASVAELKIAEKGNRELQLVVDKKIAELERARALRLEEVNRFEEEVQRRDDEIQRRDAAMMVLSERLWWKLGKKLRVL